MADVRPLKLTDLGNGEGQLDEFGTGDAVHIAALPVLGVVSQLLGVPTGAIIETGDRYIRLANGWQFCIESVVVIGTGWTVGTGGGHRYSAETTATWEQPFVATPLCVHSLADGQVAARSSWCPFILPSATGVALRAAALATTTSTSNLIVRILAIGRWF